MRVLYRQKDALQTYTPPCQMLNPRVSDSQTGLPENSHKCGFRYATVLLSDFRLVVLCEKQPVMRV